MGFGVCFGCGDVEHGDRPCTAADAPAGALPERQRSGSARPCGYPGCGENTRNYTNRCPRHPAKEGQRDGHYATRSGFSRAKWMAARNAFLLANPFCRDCLAKGQHVEATDVDHVVPHEGDAALFWDSGNWRALCHPCHSRKTYASTWGVRGADKPLGKRRRRP